MGGRDNSLEKEGLRYGFLRRNERGERGERVVSERGWKCAAMPSERGERPEVDFQSSLFFTVCFYVLSLYTSLTPLSSLYPLSL